MNLHLPDEFKRPRYRRIVAAGLAVVTLFIAFSLIIHSRFSSTLDLWQRHNAQVEQSVAALNIVQHSLGYGGLIHHFKNLVLRRDIEHIQPLLDADIAGLRSAFDRITQHLHEPGDLAALGKLRATVEKYAQNVAVAAQLIRQGKSSAEIDAAVHIDDNEAVDALAYLVARLDERSRLTETSLRASFATTMNFLRIGAAGVSLALLGALALLLVFLRRMAEARAARHALQNRIDNLLSTSPDATLAVDASGRIVFANRMAEDFFGYSHDQLIGMMIEQLLPERYRAGHTAHRARFNAAPRERTMGIGTLLKARLADGREPDVEISLSHSGEGAERLVTVAVRDISERRQTEAELLAHREHLSAMVKARTAELRAAKEAAENADRSKSDFLASMSHEIRTPMNAIMGMTHLALRAEPPPKVANYLEKVEHSGEHLLRIIDDILDFSKIEAGKMELEQADFTVHDICENLSRLLADRCEQKNLSLDFDIDAGLSVPLRGDVVRLGQILLNFAGNSIKFTTHGGITVRGRLLSEDDSGLLARFDVEDTGVGIPAEQQGKLFSAFQQADISTTRKFGGTGLGLVISSRLAHLMGGEVGLSSSEGLGSTFWFTARLGRGTLAQPVPEKLDGDPHLDLAGKRVLVVDDQPYACQIMREYLSSVGLRVDVVGNGPDAIDAVRLSSDNDDPYLIIFLDWHMPGMDGLETSRRIRELPLRYSAPPHIMVTAYNRTKLIQEARAAGFQKVLIKPVEPDSLLGSIADALGQGQTGVAQGNVAAKAGTKHQPRLSGLRILVAEDNEVNQLVVDDMLTQEEAIVTIAGDGQHALNLLEREGLDAWDIVITDVQMPLLDGYELTQAIRQQTTALPVIGLTAHAMASERQRCLDAGMQEHVTKPINLDALVAAILRHVTLPASKAQADRDDRGAPKVSAGGTAMECADVTRSDATAPATAPTTTSAAVPIIDMPALLARFQGRTNFVEKLIATALESQAETAVRLRRAADTNDHETLASLAHGIKGMAGNIKAQPVQELAALAEDAARRLSHDAPALARALAGQLDTLFEHLRSRKTGT